MDDHDKLQMQQAAAGCISGTLAEWPHLYAALKRFLEFEPPLTLNGRQLQKICGHILYGCLR